VTVGATTWHTSLCRNTGRDAYILAGKKAVRQADSLVVAFPFTITLSLVSF
jgi:hypothetical protein